MRHTLLISILLFLAIVCNASSCKKNQKNTNPAPVDTSTMTKIKITVGSKTFSATLSDNSASKAFRDMLPLTISMVELNGNEKYYEFPKNLPTNSSNPGSIHIGDLMLYGSRTLVLFYKGFSTSYSYTRLGHVDNVSGLADALGSGAITIKYELI